MIYNLSGLHNQKALTRQPICTVKDTDVAVPEVLVDRTVGMRTEARRCMGKLSERTRKAWVPEMSWLKVRNAKDISGS